MTAEKFCLKYKLKFERLKKIISKYYDNYSIELDSKIPVNQEEILVNYYKGKIIPAAKFLKLIESFQYPEITTTLQSIQFYEGYINLEGHKIPLAESKLNYQSLFNELKFLHSIPISISKSGGVYLLETSKERVLKIIQLLEVEDKFRFRNEDYPIGEKLPSWDFKWANHSFKNDKKKCLFILFEKSNHCGYLPEIILDKEKNIIKSEPSLLFIIIIKAKTFVVWESLSDLKATYVFQSSNDSFDKNYKDIIDFIGSHKFRNKREGLSENGSSDLKEDLNLKSKVEHKSTSINYSAFDNWKNSLDKALA